MEADHSCCLIVALRCCFRLWRRQQYYQYIKHTAVVFCTQLLCRMKNQAMPGCWGTRRPIQCPFFTCNNWANHSAGVLSLQSKGIELDVVGDFYVHHLSSLNNAAMRKMQSYLRFSQGRPVVGTKFKPALQYVHLALSRVLPALLACLKLHFAWLHLSWPSLCFVWSCVAEIWLDFAFWNMDLD